MNRIAFVVATFGGLLVLGSAMLAADAFLTDERKDFVRGEINASLDESAARYEENRLAGCRRKRCGGALSHMITGLRDGIFLSRPFDPEAVLPDAPIGWTVTPYSLADAETIFGAEWATVKDRPSYTRRHFADLHGMATEGSSSAAAIYHADDGIIAMGIGFDKGAVRNAKEGTVRIDQSHEDVFASLAGLPLRLHPQTSFEHHTNTWHDVPYRTFSLDVDGQAEIIMFAQASDDAIFALLSELDIRDIVDALPHAPSAYDGSDQVLLTAAATAE